MFPEVKMRYNEMTGIMIGKAFDNRLGTAVVIETMNRLVTEPVEVNVVGIISTQEEVGTRGAAVTAQQIEADLAIVLEGSPADDSFRESYESQGALGKGAQIRYFDRTMISHPRFTRMVKQLAIDTNIPHQVAVRKGGGTNAGRYHLAGRGIPSTVLGIPVRYAHTHYGISQISDYESVKALVMAVLRNFDQSLLEKL